MKYVIEQLGDGTWVATITGHKVSMFFRSLDETLEFIRHYRKEDRK